jgi:hypothetical protein
MGFMHFLQRWQIEPDAKVEPATAGYCIDEQLQPFQLRVTGDAGCNRYMQEALPKKELWEQQCCLIFNGILSRVYFGRAWC